MDIKEVLENICYHDPRSPYYEDLHGFDDVEDIPEPRTGCYCDNCFHGSDELALEILRLRAVITRNRERPGI